MKKIVFLMFALAMVANEAFAFNTFAHQTISKLTEMNLNEKTKQEVKAILKTSITKECVWLNTLRNNPEMAHTKSWHFFQLDANGKSTTMDENDGIVQLEKAIAVLRNRKNHSEAEQLTALRTVIHLVQDLHCLSHIRIEGIEATKGFTFRICLPMFAVMILLNALLGILAKVAPQMNMFSVGMQLKVLVGMCSLFLTMKMLPGMADMIYTEIRTVVVAFVEAMM